ncbi:MULTISPECIES: lysylphosphatidylglycerol synthase domain-containing protein [unclassified Saccharibacter]|uniref:lysylphosphatidylglycerol synthase domain-containing protein n=1 Tax=unclassified Saccharibacter TaxID=2648722 RepID=UPI0013244043|nr:MULTISPECIES: lysylphosphatidylglycerol synthase domain-containing protein [unclassified Saccharibacter]MXV36253.1 HpnL family protein [Saccharibacter sp. EH611]MXV57113.1 HpnL family protein [Saccharibacter sp. EH70]MXV66527.1 HpnL family protein [Saccharibacter sp. EH60]
MRWLILKKTLPFILTLIGVVLFCFLTLRTGLHSILLALGKVGIGGFILLIAVQFVVNLILGVAWKGSIADISLARLTAARFVRDAAAACLPFSQLGGMIIGIRATTAGHPCRTTDHTHIGWPEGVAANLIDITTEVLGQIAFIVLALLCLIGHQDAGRFIWPLSIAMVLLSLGMAGFIWTQQHGGNLLKRLAYFLAKHTSADWGDALTGNTTNFQNYLDSLWSRPSRIACGAALHLACWLGSAFMTWLSLRLLGVTLTFFDATAIEGVVCGIMSAGFLVPGALGVQEGAYVALGLIFGIPSDIAFSLSLLRRGRDIVIGIPTLLLWQYYEFHQLRRTQKTSTSSS